MLIAASAHAQAAIYFEIDKEFPCRFVWMDGWMYGVYANEERMRSEKPNSKQQQQQILFHPAEVLCSLRRPHAHVFDFGREVGSCSEEEDWFVTHPGTYNIVDFISKFTANMKRFLFIFSVVLTAYCSTADRFQKLQEDDINEGLGLGVAHAFTDKRQEALLATGRRWIKNQCSKCKRRITRSCGIRQDKTYISVSSFFLFFLLLLAGDVELNPGPTAASDNSSEKPVLELPMLVARGKVHQGDTSFSEESRGRQCAFMALTSLAYNQYEIAVTNWQPETVDEILDIGDSQFLDALQRGFFPDAPTLSVEQLPTTVCFAQSNEDNSDLPHGAQNEISKPIVVLPLGATKANTSEMPIEAPNNSDFPIVEGKSESPIVVINSELPIVATKAIPEKPQTETNSKLYESNLPGSSITFGNISQGSFNHDTQNDNDSPFIPLHTALENVFTDNNYAIFILDGYMVSIIHNPNSGFYVFDSHARNSFGMPDMNGKAVVLNLRNIFSLENYLQLLATALNATFFEVVSVTFHNLNSSESHDFALTINPKNRNLSAHESERQERLLRMRLHAAKKRANETEFEREKRLERRRQNRAKKLAHETEFEREERLAKRQQNRAKRLGDETEFEREERLAKRQQNRAKRLGDETEFEREERLAKRQQNRAKRLGDETEFEREERLAKRQQNRAKKLATETESQRVERLAKRRLDRAKKLANETESERVKRLAKQQQNTDKKRKNETESEKEERLAKQRQSKANKLASETESEKAQRLATNRQKKAAKSIDKTELEKTEQVQKRRLQGQNKRQNLNHDKINYLAEFNIRNGSIYEQTWAKINMNRFHESARFAMKQCKVCLETWPMRSSSVPENFSCARCSRDKKFPKRFSKENGMIPSIIPRELQGLSQTEEMLIARALPMMRVYVRPGGQRGYSGHCINLPQRVEQLASKLPRYPKDLAVIVVQMKGKNNSTRDMKVRRNVVHDALMWLLTHNPLYKELEIDQEALNTLPENGVPQDFITLNTEEEIDSGCEHDNHSLNDASNDDQVYNETTEMSSFLPLAEQQQQEIQAIRNELSEQQPLQWPTVEGANPLSEYDTPFLASMAFPTLFPDCAGDPTNEASLRNVSFQDRIKHLIKFSEKVNGKLIYRFASHPRFPYWSLNMIQRKRTLEQSGIFLKQNPSEVHLTMDELRDMAQNNSSSELMAKMSRYVANVLGSNPYWHKVKEELKAVITSKGASTIFFTFSAADMHWPDLHDILSNGSKSEMLAEERRQNVINNPHLVDWFFSQRLDNFVKHWLYETMDAEWHWYRFEYQHRGSIHCHGTAKLKNDPGLCELTEIALKGFLAQRAQSERGAFHPDVSEIIDAGKNAERKVCQYVDWLLTTVNPLPPDTETWIKPKVHPCQKRHQDVHESDLETDYVDLINTVQRHTRCSTSYCLRKKQDESELKCRFHFPFESCPETKLEFEEVHTKKGEKTFRAKVVTKRNDSRLNNHQRCQLQGWRANCDIQVVIDHYACVEYLTKYAAKGEPKSQSMNQLFKAILQNGSSENSDAKKAIKKLAMKALGERDFSAQETMHLLMSLKLHSCSFKVIPVSLTGSRKVRKQTDGDSILENEGLDVSTESSLLDAYAHRENYDESPELDSMNLAQFANKYKVFKSQLVTLPDNVVPRIFPTYSPNPAGANFALYCKFQLLRYKPWKHSQNNVWGCEDPSDETLISAWHEFLQTPYAQRNVPDWVDKLQNVVLNQEPQFEQPQQEQSESHQEDWMILAGLNATSDHASNSSANDWQKDRENYTQEQLCEMPRWIKDKKDSHNFEDHLFDVDVNCLNHRQRLAYDLVMSHSHDDDTAKDPLCLIVIGVAGTGKSYLINTLRNSLQNKCAVTATTGKAAFNIHGVTIHSLLKLPVGVYGNKDLSGESLCRLQDTLNGIEYIIIDEYSMLGQTTFGWIDRRCRQATGFLDKLLGGKSLILFGDPGQLPPVGDKPLFHSHPSNEIGKQGSFAYMMFDKVIKLTENQRVSGVSEEQVVFRDFLFRLRNGETTSDDWHLLMTRQPSSVINICEFENSIRLFYSNEQVGEFNFEQLTKLQNPIACIEARHSSAGAKKFEFR